MENSLISVIIPIYNVERYLSRCIDSVVNQTYTNLEIILVDDGSPDKCGIICDEYSKKDKRIKVIHKKNGGLSDARNAGINIVLGKYIGFIDSDDWIENNYFKRLHDLIDNYRADISVCNFIKTYNENEKFNVNLDIKINEYTNIEALEQYFDKYSIQMIVAWGKLYKAELFKSIRFPVGKIHEDEFTTHKLIYKANKVVLTTECLYYYWQRQDSIMGMGFNIKGKFDGLEALKERIEFYKQSGLEMLWNRTIINYFEEIIYLYNDLLKLKENKTTVFQVLSKSRELQQNILSDNFSLGFRVYYIMFIKFPKFALLLFKINSKIKFDLMKLKRRINVNI